MASEYFSSEARVLRVWDIVNRHFESLLAKAERSATKNRAEINIRSQVEELRDLTRACSTRLKTLEAYVLELQKQQETGAVNDTRTRIESSQLAGDWHFLYKEDNNVFGYMKLLPETVSITTEMGEGSPLVKRAQFTVPSVVLREANKALDEDDQAYCYSAHPKCRALIKYVSCPCCKMSFKASEFWKHALLEIAERGNRVPARQSLDRSETPRWTVEESSGWSVPIYRPRGLEITGEIGQCLTELNLRHFLSEGDFSRALDSSFEFLTLQLRA